MRLPGRREENLLPGGGLPTYGGSKSGSRTSSLFSSFQSNKGDGSARSIHVKAPISQQWKRATPMIKASWIGTFSCLFLMFFGYRNLRYYNSALNLNCTTRDCHIKIVPIGRKRGVRLNFSRLQLKNAYPVRTTRDGKYVDNNVSAHESDLSNKKGKKPKYSSYKGPDKDGYYLSYALIFQEKGSFDANTTQSLPQEEQPQDLSPLYPFVEHTDEGLRMVVGQFKRGVTKRRTRTMVQKISSYVSRRRSKLLVKENAAPSWVAVLMMVVGLVGFLLALLLGQFWEEDLVKNPLKGPGVRRSAIDRDSMARATPARYEVSTQPRNNGGASQTIRKRY